MVKSTLIVGCGGCIGTLLRFMADLLGGQLFPGAWPPGTFMANMTGCLLIGIFTGLASRRNVLDRNGELFLITGLCGGFTTYSTFAFELDNMLATGQDSLMWMYLLGSIVGGMLLAALGLGLTRTKIAKEAVS